MTLDCTNEVLVAIDVEVDCRILYKKSVIIAIYCHYSLWTHDSDGIVVAHNVEVAILLVESVILVIVKNVHDYKRCV